MTNSRTQNSSPKPFDNVMLRLRGNRCFVAPVEPPFGVVYWPDVVRVASELGLPVTTAAQLHQPAEQEAFLTALAQRELNGERFGPARVGFKILSNEVRRRENFRQNFRRLTILGDCPKDVTFAALELVADQVSQGATVDIEFKYWDALADWDLAQERLREVCSCFYQARGFRGGIFLFSKLLETHPALWEFVYSHPRVRISWSASELAGCRNRQELEDFTQMSIAFKNLEKVSHEGLWPHVVLPVSSVNTNVLPDLVEVLLNATRGGTVELMPAPFVAPCSETKAAYYIRRGDEAHSSANKSAMGQVSAPRVQEYVEALVACCRNPRIPLRLVSPLSWVLNRVESPDQIFSSPLSAGAELAVLANGDLYAGESSVGLKLWHLGNVLEGGMGIRWERLDAMLEAFSDSLKPQMCRECGWRYRCGGVDPSVFLLNEADKQKVDRALANGPPLFDLYCAPRNRMFEELIWSSLETAARRQGPKSRELIELRKEGIDFKAVLVGEGHK